MTPPPSPAAPAPQPAGVGERASAWLPGARVSVDAETLTALVILMDGERGAMPPAARVAVKALADTARPLAPAPSAGAVDADDPIGAVYLEVHALIDAIVVRERTRTDGTIARARDVRKRLLDMIDALAAAAHDADAAGEAVGDA